VAVEAAPGFRLDGEAALVTGAGRGIGRAIAARLAAAGAAVALADIDAQAAEGAAAALREGGARAIGLALDVADEASVDAATARTRREFGRLDVLVANAGTARRGPATDLARADWDAVLAVNLTGVFLCARAAAREMREAGGGRIVATASIMGLSGGLYPNAPYQATKGAIVNLVRALALEWASAGIRVNAVAPTWVNTELTAGLFADPVKLAEMRAATPLGFPTPDDVAAAALFLVSPASAFVTGHTLPVDGGFLAR
jgi:NAD(P)-dependent dehydrogenase (short-subunit alcohol dehydrogenase family)